MSARQWLAHTDAVCPSCRTHTCLRYRHTAMASLVCILSSSCSLPLSCLLALPAIRSLSVCGVTQLHLSCTMLCFLCSIRSHLVIFLVTRAPRCCRSLIVSHNGSVHVGQDVTSLPWRRSCSLRLLPRRMSLPRRLTLRTHRVQAVIPRTCPMHKTYIMCLPVPLPRHPAVPLPSRPRHPAHRRASSPRPTLSKPAHPLHISPTRMSAHFMQKHRRHLPISCKPLKLNATLVYTGLIMPSSPLRNTPKAGRRTTPMTILACSSTTLLRALQDGPRRRRRMTVKAMVVRAVHSSAALAQSFCNRTCQLGDLRPLVKHVCTSHSSLPLAIMLYPSRSRLAHFWALGLRCNEAMAAQLPANVPRDNPEAAAYVPAVTPAPAPNLDTGGTPENRWEYNRTIQIYTRWWAVTYCGLWHDGQRLRPVRWMLEDMDRTFDNGFGVCKETWSWEYLD